MQLHERIDQVRTQLGAAAALGDERTQQIAGNLATAAESAVRLAILDAASELTADVTTALAAAGVPGNPTVSVHLDGDELEVRVNVQPEPVTDPPADDGEATARISLRLSEELKASIEEAAGEQSVSVNTWLVRAARAQLGGRGGGWGGWGGPDGPWNWGGPGGRGGGPGGRGPGGRGGRGGGSRTTGWVTG